MFHSRLLSLSPMLQPMDQNWKEINCKKKRFLKKFSHSIFCVSSQIRSLLPSCWYLGCKKNWKCFQVPWEILFLPPSASDDRKEKNVWDQIYLIWYRRRELDTQTTRMREIYFLLKVLFTPRWKSQKEAGIDNNTPLVLT